MSSLRQAPRANSLTSRTSRSGSSDARCSRRVGANPTFRMRLRTTAYRPIADLALAAGDGGHIPNPEFRLLWLQCQLLGLTCGPRPHNSLRCHRKLILNFGVRSPGLPFHGRRERRVVKVVNSESAPPFVGARAVNLNYRIRLLLRCWRQALARRTCLPTVRTEVKPAEGQDAEPELPHSTNASCSYALI